jgi:two-component system LytT family response regulator
VARAQAELDIDRRLAGLERSLAGDGRHLERLALRVGPRVEVVAVADVSCFVSEGRHTYVHAGPREYISELSLVHFEERLDPAAWARVHRGALVSLARLARVAVTSVELDDGRRLPLSRRSRGPLLARLGAR